MIGVALQSFGLGEAELSLREQLARLGDLDFRTDTARVARRRRIEQEAPIAERFTGDRQLRARSAELIERNCDLIDELLVRAVELDVGGVRKILRGSERRIAAAEIEQQPIERQAP